MLIHNSRKIRRHGSTLTEVVITTALFSVIMLSLFAILDFGTRSWTSVEGRTAVQSMLRKVEVCLMDDLRRASYSRLAVPGVTATDWPDGLPDVYRTAKAASADSSYCKAGNAIWFLSAVKHSTDGSMEFVRDSSGYPLWQTNVLYYVAVPGQAYHKRTIGGKTCSGGDKCPHKLLIRKEIRLSKGSDPELLIKSEEISKYMTAPEDYDVTSMTKETGVQRVQVLADSIISFTAVLDIPQVLVTIKAFRLAEARKRIANFTIHKIGVGGANEYDKFTVQYNVSLIPNN